MPCAVRSIRLPLLLHLAASPACTAALQVFIPLGILTGVPGVTWDAFLFKNLIPGEAPACASVHPFTLVCRRLRKDSRGLPLLWAGPARPAWGCRPPLLCATLASSSPLQPNPVAVTLGNIFAGAVCVATLYSLAYGKLGKRVQRALDLAELLRLRRAGLRDSR